jgi:tRNA uracil 4-sulfurtransferase
VDRFFVIHYNELGLKKGNRDYFENRLCANINAVLEDCGAGKAHRISGRILLPLTSAADISQIKHRLGKVFGVAYFAESWTCPQSVEEMETQAWSLIHPRSFNSFRIEARRADKRFPHTSVEINQRVGAYVKERSGARVDLENPELTCTIEVLDRQALIYLERLPGPGGLPVGTSGKVVVLLSGRGMEDDQAWVYTGIRSLP